MIAKKLGEFEVLGKIGAGGMGEVYRGRDHKLQRDVALKILPGAFVADPERLARFKREARTLASLNHTNVAALYDFADENGTPYLVMEYVEGEDLADRLARGPIPLEDVLDVARQIADGLEEAHEKGIVHRDLKPANVKLAPDGRVKILDFGLARAYLGETVDEGNIDNTPTITAAMTQQGVILGTAAYMSPEQARGKSVDRRADLWSFGVILWEMLTGKRLFEGETISDILAAVLRKEPTWDDLPEDTPTGVRRLLERCLERDPRKRLRDIGEARIRLERWRDDPSSMHISQIGFEIPPEGAASGKARWLPWAVAGIAVAAALWGWMAPKEQATAGPDTMWMDIRLPHEDQLPDDLKGGVVISPQGDRLAYLADNAIYVRRLDRLDPIRLPGTEGALMAEFSPDGQWIAFWANGWLQRISVTGGAPIRISEMGTCRGFGWIDKASLVVAISINTGLSIVSLETGEIRELTTLDLEGGERSHRWPAVIPGGEYVLMMAQFLGRNYEDSDIQLVSLKDGTRQTVYSGGAYPHYAPSGHLLFARDQVVFAAPFVPGRGEATGLPVPVLQHVLTSVVNQEIDDGSAAYDLSPSGTLVYRSGEPAATGLNRIAWLDIATGVQVAFGVPAPRDTPILSPDGKSVAFSRGDSDAKSVYVLDLSTQIERRLTFEVSDQLGSWSLDSQFLYWARAGQDGWSLYKQKADGSTPEEKLRDFGSAIFTPRDITVDGRYLIGSQWQVGVSYDVVLLSLEDPEGEIIKLVDSPDTEFPADLSPDGKWLPYLLVEGGLPSVHIMPYPDTGARWQLTESLDRFDGAYWIEDGTALIIRDGTGLLRVDVEVRGASILSSPPRRILEEDNVRLSGTGSFAMTPDGKRAIVLQPENRDGDENPRSIIFVNDWLRDLVAQVAAAQ